MSQAPSMPFFVDAYLADTGHLTVEEHGAYLLLLFAMWRRGGEVPDDDRDNARVTRMAVGKWRKVKERLRTFLTFEDGAISQKRLKKEWKYVAEKRAKNAQNGARGGRPVLNENNDIAKANGSLQETQTKANPVPVPVPKEEEESSSLRSDVSADADARPPAAPSQPDLLDIPEFLRRQPPDSAPPQPVAEIVSLDPLQRAKDAYNLTVEFVNTTHNAGWSACQNLNETRRKKLRKRLEECGGIHGWTEAMKRAAASKKLLGLLPRSPEFADWRPGFDFFLQAKSFTKLMEGFYDDATGNAGSGGSILDRAAHAAAIALAGGRGAA